MYSVILAAALAAGTASTPACGGYGCCYSGWGCCPVSVCYPCYPCYSCYPCYPCYPVCSYATPVQAAPSSSEMLPSATRDKVREKEPVRERDKEPVREREKEPVRERDKETPDKPKTGGSDGARSGAAPALIIVSLPANARLRIDDYQTSLTSDTRRFRSPVLQPGKDYAYILQAEIVRAGQKLTTQTRVTVHAGESTHVVLPASQFVDASVAQK